MSQPSIADQLRPLFQPAHVAVIGASRTPGRTGHNVVANLIQGGFPGRISPINPSGGELAGLPIAKSVRDLDQPADCAMIVVPADAVLEAARDCAESGVRALVVGATGFAEIGTDEGRARQAELTRIARASGMRVIGPNTNGIYNATDRLSLGYNAEHADPLFPGDISFVSHSGALFGGAARTLRRLGLGLSKFVPVGNEADLDMLDILEYYIADDATRVIGLIMEGLADGARLRRLAVRAHAAGKPIVALKLGRSEVGAGATLAHSSRLAGKARAYDALFRECGIASVRSVEALAGGCAVLATSSGREPGRDQALIGVTTSGAGGALIADYAVERGIAMAGEGGEWTGPAGERIGALPHSGPLRNPTDLGALPGNWAGIGDILAILDDHGIGGPVAVYGHVAPRPQLGVQLLEAMAARRRACPAPMVLVAPGGIGEAVEPGYRDAGIPVFTDIGTGMDSLACHYAVLAPPSDADVSAGPDGKAAAALLAERAGGAAGFLSEIDSAEILRRAGVAMVESRRVATADDAARAAVETGYPVVLKAIAPDVSHKAAAGFVKAGIAHEGALKDAFADIEARLAARGYAAGSVPIIVQEMLSARLELLAGLSTEPALGRFLVFGLGGVDTEELDRVTLLPVPLDPSVIRARVAESVVGRILAKRGSAGGVAPLDGFVATLVALQDFALAAGDALGSVDVNPVLVTERGCIAVDGLIVPHAGS